MTNLFKKIAATALAGLAVLGSASSAFARPQLRPYDQEGARVLLDTVRGDGVSVYIDDEYCFKPENRGLFGAATRDKKLLLCVKNHGGDLPELADTLRHEVVHLAQYCKGRIVGASIATLQPQHTKAYVRHAIEVLNMPADLYDPNKWAVEAEARVFAQYMDERQVASLYNQYCVRPYQTQVA